MNKYNEDEIKVLDINVEDIKGKLEEMGAKKVFDGDRVFTTFDNLTSSYLDKDILIRLTEEEKLKLSVSNNTSKSSIGEKQTVKVFVSRKQEMVDLFKMLDIVSISEVRSHRTSYELETSKGIMDFEIDQFPLIPAFLEIDLDNMEVPLEQLLESLGLKNNKVVTVGTEDVYKIYGIDYFEQFKIDKN